MRALKPKVVNVNPLLVGLGLPLWYFLSCILHYFLWWVRLSSVVSFKVPREVKERMKRLGRYVNWAKEAQVLPD